LCLPLISTRWLPVHLYTTFAMASDPSRCEHLEKMAIAYTVVMGHTGQEFQGGQDVECQARRCHDDFGSVRRHKLSQCGEDLEAPL